MSCLMCVCSVPISEAKVNRWKPSPTTWCKTRLLARLDRHRWKEQATTPRQKWKVIHSKTFYREGTFQLPTNYVAVHCPTTVIQRRDATTYFLKPLPHCTRLTSEQTFWEFCQETEEQFKLSFITNKTLKDGARRVLCRKGHRWGPGWIPCGTRAAAPRWHQAGGRRSPGPPPCRASRESKLNFLIHRSVPDTSSPHATSKSTPQKPKALFPSGVFIWLDGICPLIWLANISHTSKARPDVTLSVTTASESSGLYRTPCAYHPMIFFAFSLTSEFFFFK